jgi:hypothetical protein
MRWNKGLVVGLLVASLLGAASMFQLAAPQDYGSPKAEVLAPGPTGVRVNEANLYQAALIITHAPICADQWS